MRNGLHTGPVCDKCSFRAAVSVSFRDTRSRNETQQSCLFFYSVSAGPIRCQLQQVSCSCQPTLWLQRTLLSLSPTSWQQHNSIIIYNTCAHNVHAFRSRELGDTSLTDLRQKYQRSRERLCTQKRARTKHENPCVIMHINAKAVLHRAHPNALSACCGCSVT